MTHGSSLPKSPRILLVEDEPGLVMTMQDRLRSAGYTPEHAPDGQSALAILESTKASQPDLVLLDIMLPDMEGFEICARIRKKGNMVPVLMLTARGATDDKVKGLKTGADDYLTKPFSLSELMARIEALLRRAHLPSKDSSNTTDIINTNDPGSLPGSPLCFGNWELKPASHTLLALDGTSKAQQLSATEFRLLHHLASNPGRIFSRDELLDAVWGYNNEVTSRTVDVHIAWLRQKLSENHTPRHIHTIRKSGYRFDL